MRPAIDPAKVGNMSREAFAAFDIGTTSIKGSVLLPGGAFRLLTPQPNEVQVTSGGGATCSAKQTVDALRILFVQLAHVVSTERVSSLHVGLCGHVSSLIVWNEPAAGLEYDEFPIWMDTTSRASVPALREFLAGGRDREILGTTLPVVPNWLAVMIHDRFGGRVSGEVKVLQVHDYVYHLLTGAFHTHYSGQVSILNNDTLDYADEMLAYIGAARSQLPEIAEAAAKLRDPYKTFDGIKLPSDTYVYPGLADRTAGFVGMQLDDCEGFMLASTSENSGIYLADTHPIPTRLMRTRQGEGWIHYGSTSAGGSTVAWFVDRFGAGDGAAGLHSAAAGVPPGSEGLLFEPYLSGERAPLWNDALSGSFVGLRTHHRREHLFRALLEGIAYGKRQLFDELPSTPPRRIKIAGGGARHALQNQIRAAVLKVTLEVYEDAEFALLGLIRHMQRISAEGDPDQIPTPTSTIVEPDPRWSAAYDRAYEVFLELQSNHSGVTEQLTRLREAKL